MNVPCADLYVTKFDPTGTQIIYSTYIGRAQQEVRPSLVVTPEGEVYLAGTAYPAGYHLPESAGGTAFVVKLDRTGSRLHYWTSLGENTQATSLAVDAQGNAVVAGISYSIGFPQKGGLSYPASPAGAFVTRDNGATWAPVQGHLPPQGVYSVIADPARPSVLYAATELGLWRTRDRGANWISVLPEPEIVRSVAADARSGAVYALGASGRLWQSRSDGQPWHVLKLPSSSNKEVRAFAVDPARSGAVWVLQGSGTLVRSDDGGVTWIDVNTFGYGALSPKEEAGIIFDPRNPFRLYVSAGLTLYRSVDAGKTWERSGSSFDFYRGSLSMPVFDGSDSSILYASWKHGVLRSTDGGTEWSPVNVPAPQQLELTPYSLVTTSSGDLYVADVSGLWKRKWDGVWGRVAGPWTGPGVGLSLAGDAVYVTLASPPPEFLTMGFLAKIDNSGATAWSTLVGGPGTKLQAVGTDGSGDIYVTGSSSDKTLMSDSTLLYERPFVAKLAGAGTRLLFLTPLGGVEASALAIDSAGDVWIGGKAGRPNVPGTANSPIGSRMPNTYGSAWLAKVDPVGNVLTAMYLGGSTGYGGSTEVRRIVVERDRSVWAVGSAETVDFPLVSAVEPNCGSCSWLVHVDSAGRELLTSSYLPFGVASLALPPSRSLWLAGGEMFGRIDHHLPDVSASPEPVIYSLRNAAGQSFLKFSTVDQVTPGMIVSLFGTRLARSAASSSVTPLPTVMQGVSVLVGGIPAPLFYVSPDQINFQVPDVGTGSPSTIVVKTGAGSSPAWSVFVTTAEPGIFTTVVNGKLLPVIVRASDYSLVTETRPALPGDTLIVWCTGLGSTTPAVPAGAAPGAYPTSLKVTGIMDHGTQGVLWSGHAPGFPGLYQVNFQVSEGQPSGPIPFQLQVSGNPNPVNGSTNSVPLYIR